MTNETAIKELFKNEEFVAKLEEVDSKEDAKALFKEYGAELTDEMIDEITSAESEELNENALQAVSGGMYDGQGRKRSFGQFLSYFFTAAFVSPNDAYRLNKSWGR